MPRRFASRVADGDPLAVAAVCERLDRLAAVEAGLLRERQQRRLVADVRRFRPVGIHEARVHGLVHVPVAGQLGDLECLQRVRDDLGRRVVRVAAGLDHALHLVGVALAVAGVQLGAGNPLGRVLGVQVERKPFDRGAEPAREPRRPLVGDVAERSDVVAPDPDDVRCRHATKSSGAPPERVIFRRGEIAE